MCLEILEAPQVDRLSGPELPHDDPHHGIVGTGGEMAIGRIAAEVDELADQILDVGSRPVRVAKRPHRVEPTPPATHLPPLTRIVARCKSKSQ